MTVIKDPNIVFPANTYQVFSRGSGAAEEPLPSGYTNVSRWVLLEEASLWAQNGGTAVSAGIPRNGTLEVYTTACGAPYQPDANGTVKIDFTVSNGILRLDNASSNFLIRQPT